MATTLTSTGITFSDATSQTTAVNDISDLNANVSNTELGYLDGVTSAIQTQLNTKAATSSLGNLATANTVGSSTITDNSVTADELNVSGDGTAGQLLASDGDGSFSWTDAPGGSLSFVEIQTFNSSGTWTKPNTANLIDVYIYGGVGAGTTTWNNATNCYDCAGAGGGAPGVAYISSDASNLSASYTVTVGASGTVGTPYAQRNGNSGGNSSFGNIITANGGGGGTEQGYNATGGNGGNASTNLSSNQYNFALTANGGKGGSVGNNGTTNPQLGSSDFAGYGGRGGKHVNATSFTYTTAPSRSAFHYTEGGAVYQGTGGISGPNGGGIRVESPGAGKGVIIAYK